MPRRDPDPDLSALLESWAFQQGQITSRVIRAHDGLPRVQIRLEFGIVQMHYSGRPDGTEPGGHPTLLEFIEFQRDAASAEGAGDPPPLAAPDVSAMRDEVSQFYHRCLALLAAGEFESALRDVLHLIRAIDLVAAAAEEAAARTLFEPIRPHLLALRARTLAATALSNDMPQLAAAAIDEGLEAIEGLKPDKERSPEVKALRALRDSIDPAPTMSQGSELRARLAKALAQENYELAAILRDELRLINEWP